MQNRHFEIIDSLGVKKFRPLFNKNPIRKLEDLVNKGAKAQLGRSP